MSEKLLIACSGHRIGTAEIESALVSHLHCAEAAVVGVDHQVKLQLCASGVKLHPELLGFNLFLFSFFLSVASGERTSHICFCHSGGWSGLHR